MLNIVKVCKVRITSCTECPRLLQNHLASHGHCLELKRDLKVPEEQPDQGVLDDCPLDSLD